MMDDDDDRFLYGDSDETEEVSKPQPIPVEQVAASTSTNGVVAHLEAQVSAEGTPSASEKDPSRTPEADNMTGVKDENGDEMKDEGEGEGEGEGGEEEEAEEEEEEESDDDIEIIMEPPSRSLDFRQQRPRQPTAAPTTPAKPLQQPAPSLTTEYTPRDRNAPPTLSATPQPASAAPSTSASAAPAPTATATTDSKATPAGPSSDAGGIDPSTLPPVTAPPSHPSIDPSVPGTFEGRSVLEVDLASLQDKPWRRPGSDLSDWFNYGFDEISWEAYCFRRRELGDVAGVLKGNVLNFAGMPEEQLAALPPEIRTMVMAGATAMMNGGNVGANPGAGGMGGGGMMPAGMNMGGNMGVGGNMGGMMNPMMEMGPMMMHDMDAVSMAMAQGMGGQGGMQGMGMGGMQGMGPQMGPNMQEMGGGDGMGGQMGGQGMGGGGMGGQMGGQMSGQGMGGQGMGGQGMGGQGMGGQGMGGQGMGGQSMGGRGMNNGALSGGVGLSSSSTSQPQGRATPDQHGRPVGVESFPSGPGSASSRGGGGAAGSGGGDYPTQDAVPAQPQAYPDGPAEGVSGIKTPAQTVTPTRNVTPGYRARGPMQPNVPLRGAPRGGYVPRGGRGVRPASPLPPNVPTGPRNKNKYKDIDNSAPAVDGLDYGGGKERSTPPDHDERSSRKRRGSHAVDEGRSSKRR